MRTLKRSFALLAPLALVAVVVAGCGGSSNNTSTSKGGTASGAPVSGAKKGGNATVLALADVDSLDPGYWYYQYDYMALAQPTQRWLYSWKPTDTTPTPDIAAAMPKTSADGKTVTIKIRPGINYSAPLKGKTVKAADIAYALSRDLNPRTGNGYAGAYYSNIVGADAVKAGKTEKLSGVSAPDATTLVIKLTKPTGVISTAQALGLPGTVPVPESYAAKYDKGSQSTYGAHQVFTGPYMIKNDGNGKMTGYVPGKRIELVRNPDYNGKQTGDYRPAYLDTITFLGGNDITVASRRIVTGQGLLSGDFAAPPTSTLKQLVTTKKSQTVIQSAGSLRMIALNTKVKPFDNINVRKAVNAVIDKNTLRLTRGGPAIGAIATHIIPPGLSGYAEAGGAAGPGLDYAKNPNGDLQLAMSYMKKAGYSSGKYTGGKVLMVGDNQPPASKTGEAIQSELQKLGFNLTYRQVQHPTMLSKFCGVPKAAVAICPNLGWGKDFFDGQSFVDPLFNGKNIAQTNNSNYPQVDDPKINALLAQGSKSTDDAARAKIYGDVDKMIMEGAYVVPWLWDNDVNFASTNVAGVSNKFNASWDMNYTSLKGGSS
jgi:peptide/nickel transport system substrate-binding protein